MKIQWKILDGWSTRNPKKDPDTNSLIIFMPYGLPDCILMPGDDALIPTGLDFPGIYERFIIIPIHHTYPNKKSDIMEMWDGKLGDKPVLHMSICVDNSQVYIHMVNLGQTELKYKSGTKIAYFCFSPIIDLSDEDDGGGYSD